MKNYCKNSAIKVGGLLHMVVELRMQYFGETFLDSFETYETFLRCIFVQQEYKWNL